MFPLAAPVPVLVAWILNRVVIGRFDHLPSEQVSAATALSIAIADALITVVAYAASTMMLIPSAGQAAKSSDTIGTGVVLCMLLAESCLRYLGASASLGGDLLLRVANSLPTGRVLFACWPLLGGLAGTVIRFGTNQES